MEHFLNVNWENSDTPVELNAVTPGPRISVLSYTNAKHKWQHSLLNETLFYSYHVRIVNRWSFHLNKLKWSTFYLTDFPSRPHVLTFSFISPWQVYNKSSRVKKLTLIRALRFALWKVLGNFLFSWKLSKCYLLFLFCIQKSHWTICWIICSIIICTCEICYYLSVYLTRSPSCLLNLSIHFQNLFAQCRALRILL